MDLVFFNSRDWEYFPRKPHIKALSMYASSILCVDTPITLLSPIIHLNKFIKFLKTGPNIKKIGDNLYLFTPLSFFPYAVSHVFPILKPLDKILMTYSTNWALKKLNMKCTISFIFNPHQDFLLKCLNAKLSCYEAVDQYSAYPEISIKDKKRKIDRELKILKEADLVFVTSNNLYKDKVKYNKNTYFIPNTTDIHHFGKARSNKTLIPKDIAHICHPIIGFIGNINALLNLDLVCHIAESRPHWSIIIIGNITGTRMFKQTIAFKNLEKYRNIHYIGWRDYNDLPAYLKSFDVCILPYKTSEYMKYVYPNKIHQYFSSGKPVVSTCLPELTPFKEFIRFAKNNEEFVDAIEKSLDEDDYNLVLKRVKIADSNSSENRAKRKIEIIENLLNTYGTTSRFK